MIIEAREAFYNEETGAVQPWRDIEVTDTLGNELVGEGIAIAIAEGGGGGGDFSTCTLTIVGEGSLNVPNIVEYGDKQLIYWRTYSSPATVVLMGGLAFAGVAEGVVNSVSGSIEYDDEQYGYIISGDCTVTFGAGPV